VAAVHPLMRRLGQRLVLVLGFVAVGERSTLMNVPLVGEFEWLLLSTVH